MLQCREIIAKLDALAPRTLACDWDNPGLLAGRSGKEIHRVLVALDATDAVVELAKTEQVDMLITHHPLIFKPLRAVNDENFISRCVVSLLQADIAYFAMHTNFDIAPGCMADLAAVRLDLVPEGPLEVTAEMDGSAVGIGKIGMLPEPMRVAELAALVKKQFSLPFVTVYGADRVAEPVQRIAVSPGAGGSMLAHGLAARVPVLVTGDVGHHDGIDAAENHMAVIDAGHYGLEHIFIPFVREYLEGVFPGELEVLEAPLSFPSYMV